MSSSLVREDGSGSEIACVFGMCISGILGRAVPLLARDTRALEKERKGERERNRLDRRRVVNRKREQGLQRQRPVILSANWCLDRTSWSAFDLF